MGGRSTSGRVVRDKSVAEETSSAPGVSDHKHAVQTVKRLRVYTDSALHNADADADDEASDDKWLARAKQSGIRVLSQHWGLGMCGESGRS